MPSERKVTLAEFEAHLGNTAVPRRIDEVIVHHTWSPTAAQYAGISTVAGVRRYHMQVRGWSDNGYHVMVPPVRNEVFLCRPLARSGAHCLNHNTHSVGVSFIADFDKEDPQRYGGMEEGVQVVAALCRRFGLPVSDVRFHREFADKSCPGTKMSLSWFRTRVQVALADGSDEDGEDGEEGSNALRVVLLDGSEFGTVVDCAARLEEGTTRCGLRALAEALGYVVTPHIDDQGKVYLRKGGE